MGDRKVKALQTVLNLDVGVKLTEEQVEELKVAVNAICASNQESTNDNYRLKIENAKLAQQLAKANERVKELERQKEILEYYNGDVNAIVDKFLPKFAIEKKIEALNTLKLKAVQSIHKNWIVNPMNGVESPGVDELMKTSVGLNTAMIDSEIEQLRKEQE